MAVNVNSPFKRQYAGPLDDSATVADLTALDAIAAGVRFLGMEIYVVSEEQWYALKAGLTNVDWEPRSSGGVPNLVEPIVEIGIAFEEDVSDHTTTEEQVYFWGTMTILSGETLNIGAATTLNIM